jgi:phosphoribosylanthranilate isomerase
MVRVKFCGLKDPQDLLAAAALGVDAIGLVFHPNSPRNLTIQQAQDLLTVLPPFVTSVGLFANASTARVTEVLQQVPLDLLQFHGEESPEFCRQFHRPYIKALRIQPGVDIIRACDDYHDAQGLMVDAYHPLHAGGSGVTFDWELIPAHCPKPLILAGGLSANNVKAAILQVKPYAVDVSSGIEKQPGVKDVEKMRAFMCEVNSV